MVGDKVKGERFVVVFIEFWAVVLIYFDVDGRVEIEVFKLVLKELEYGFVELNFNDDTDPFVVEMFEDVEVINNVWCEVIEAAIEYFVVRVWPDILSEETDSFGVGLTDVLSAN